MDNIMRLRLDIAYDGTDFSGWAIQPDQRTVCGEITQALELVLQSPLHLTVAGRTDAGVHATGQVAHVDIPRDRLATRSLAGDPQRLVRRVARLLPPDVTISSVVETPAEFDARFSALRRHYVYRVANQPFGANPLRARDTASWHRPLDRARRQVNACSGLTTFLPSAAIAKAPRPFGTCNDSTGSGATKLSAQYSRPM